MDIHCYRKGGCGPYENCSCSECPASKPEYAERYKNNLTKEEARQMLQDCGILDENGQFVDAYKDIITPKVTKSEEVHKTGYERVNYNQTYFIVDGNGEIDESREEFDDVDLDRDEAANYYSDKTVAENNARADKLMRQLRRFAVKHRKEEIDYIEGIFEISYDVGRNMFEVELVNFKRYFGSIPFDTEETAELAIKEFYDELIWYFTEYNDGIKYL